MNEFKNFQSIPSTEKIDKAETVPIDGYKVVDLDKVKILSTYDVLRCVVVVAYDKIKNRGGIFHMTVFSNVNDWLTVIKQNFDASETEISLYGGDDVSRDSSLQDLPNAIYRSGFKILNSRLWEGKPISVHLHSGGNINVQ